MIGNRQDLKNYCEADRKALGMPLGRPKLVGQVVWKFQRLLRRVEYWTNCRRDPWGRLVLKILSLRLYRLSVRTGLQVPPNTCGPGLSIAHYGCLIIHSQAKIGAQARIHQGVVVGAHKAKAPTLGDGVYLGPGAKVFGDIIVADDVKIGANAVVTKSILTPGVTVVGIPARALPHKEES